MGKNHYIWQASAKPDKTGWGFQAQNREIFESL